MILEAVGSSPITRPTSLLFRSLYCASFVLVGSGKTGTKGQMSFGFNGM